MNKDIMDYEEAVKRFKRARTPAKGKPLNGKGTRRLIISSVSPTGDIDSPEVVIALRYHHTEVVRWYPDGTVRASLGGYNTPSTKAAIRQTSPLTLYSDDGRVYGSCHYDSSVPGTAETWFGCRNRRNIGENGEQLDYCIFKAPKAKPLPQKRNPLVKPLRGDVLQDDTGRHWIVWRLNEGIATLVPYGGDYDEEHVCIDATVEKTLSVLEKIVAGAYWKAVPRFPWRSK